MKGTAVTHSNALVCFLDVLGFKGLIDSKTNEDLLQLYDSTLTTINKIIEKEDRLNEVMKSAIAGDYVMKKRITSDSIILWYEECNPITFAKMVTQTNLLLFAGLLHGMPLRGAITTGELGELQLSEQTMESVLAGKALSDAYVLEKDQIWSGCVISPDVIDYYNSFHEENYVTIDQLVEHGRIAEYDVPFKGDEQRKYYIVDWREHFPHKLPKGSSVEGFMLKHCIHADFPVKQKVKNTVTFLNL